jgi:hypothetical protein
LHQQALHKFEYQKTSVTGERPTSQSFARLSNSARGRRESNANFLRLYQERKFEKRGLQGKIRAGKQVHALVKEAARWFARLLFTHSHTHYCTPLLLVQQVFYSKSVGGILASQSNQALKSPDRWLILKRSLARSLGRPLAPFQATFQIRNELLLKILLSAPANLARAISMCRVLYCARQQRGGGY